jgi:DivIVA domain-containing protein
MAADVTPQGIRAVQFREKLRGYHPEDVDAFVADVAKGVEELERRLKVAESRALELESRQEAASDAEDSLRRTLVLAQRTADAAIQEARDEAAQVVEEARRQRAEAEAEVAELRERLTREAEDEGRSERERLLAERHALLADVEALRGHVERERERLRIYFTDQLRRVEQGDPSVAPAPAMSSEDGPVDAGRASNDDDDDTDDRDGARDADGRDRFEGRSGDADRDDDRGEDDLDDDRRRDDGGDASGDEDPFLAELRRAVTDDRPLGPRDDDPPTRPSGDDGEDGDGFDLFAKGEDDPGRFGSRLRRRR